MTIMACPKRCGGAVNTALSNVCDTCGADATQQDIPYGDPNRCTLRTKGPDSWGCHKRKGHDTSNGGRWCSTHDECGFVRDGVVCGLRPGHDNNLHE